MFPGLTAPEDRQTASKRIAAYLTCVTASFLAAVLFGFQGGLQAPKNIPGERGISTVAMEIQPRLFASYGKLPLRFEANRGQTGARVRFPARRGYGVFLTEHEAVLSLRNSPAGMNWSGKLGLTRRHEPFGPVVPRAGGWPNLAKGSKSPSLISDLSQLVPDPNAGKAALRSDFSSPCPTSETHSGPTEQSPQALRVHC